MAPDTLAIDCRSVSHRHNGILALDDVALALKAGTTMAVIGPDGVGKSTLLGLIAGVRRMQVGRLNVLGGDMRSARHRATIAPRVAYMPQGLGRNLYPSLSVAENLDFIGRLFGLDRPERRSRTARLLSATGLAAFPERPAGQLSGGMKQKLSLCAALLHEPDLLVLDEPTTGIDPLSRRQFWELIAALRAEAGCMTVAVATAYMEEAEQFDRVLVLDRGKALDEGPVAEVLARAGAASLEAAYTRLQARDDRAVAARFVMPPRPSHDGPPAIRAEGLTRRFGAFTAVDDVNFVIEQGEIFGFTGSNGCGKTTTMKMLTGLLPASAGRAVVLGRPVGARDVEARLEVGYMSQAFSLYQELSVQANIELHARLYRIAEQDVAGRVTEALGLFDLASVADAMPMSLPLGHRQRLQLAVACLHKPRILILDEPTSGVDPAARDRFWSILGRLSREDGVTIFVSTHFMNEAERCDRISLMHAGKVLSVGAPADLVRRHGASDLDDTFVRCIAAAGDSVASPARQPLAAVSPTPRMTAYTLLPFGRIRRTWAFARRESVELLRDPIRLAFALLGPVILILTFGYGISFDVDGLRFAVHDRDQSAESRRLVEAFAGSRYFVAQPPAASDREAERRMRNGELDLLISVPPGFGSELATRRRPEISFLVNGTSPFRAETMRGYIDGITRAYAAERAREASIALTSADPGVEMVTRFRYNQSFKTVLALMPGIIMMILAMIPSMLAAIGIVREREVGSIINLYISPAGVGEFLLGKQLPYIVLSFASFILLLTIAILHFGLVIKGSLAGLLLAGLLYVFAMTAFGMLVSSFVKSQVAALIATAVICQVPALNFSGFLHPAGALEGSGYVIGHAFPALYFQNVSIGMFAKARGFFDFGVEYAVLLALGMLFLVSAWFLLEKQER